MAGRDTCLSDRGRPSPGLLVLRTWGPWSTLSWFCHGRVSSHCRAALPHAPGPRRRCVQAAGRGRDRVALFARLRPSPTGPEAGRFRSTVRALLLALRRPPGSWMRSPGMSGRQDVSGGGHKQGVPDLPTVCFKELVAAACGWPGLQPAAWDQGQRTRPRPSLRLGHTRSRRPEAARAQPALP